MPLMDDPEELLDLVDEHDQKLGIVAREDVMGMPDGKPGFVRAANSFVVNDQGEVWVPRRAPHKKIAPNGLDYSVGEHVGTGESYIDAIVRGFREELGLELAATDLAYVGKVLPQPGVPYFESIYIYRANEVSHYNRDDFASYEWLTPQAFRDRLLAGEPAKKGILPALDLLVSYNKERRD